MKAKPASDDKPKDPLKLREYRNQQGLLVRLWRNKSTTRCTFTTADDPAKCPHCNDLVMPGHMHACESSFNGKMWSKKNEKVTMFER